MPTPSVPTRTSTRSAATELSRRIARATKDGRLTRAELTRQLQPLIDQLPRRAGEEARALLALWADTGVEMELLAKESLERSLLRLGYPAGSSLSTREDSRRVPKRSARAAAAFARENVTERDEAFERLVQRAGQQDARAVIAVIDDGAELTHPAFAEKLWRNPKEVAGNGVDDDRNGHVDDLHGWNFFDPEGELSAAPHGTHVLGLSTQGTDRIRAIPLQAIRLEEDFTHFSRAVRYAAKAGARIINLSFRTLTPAGLRQVKKVIEAHPNVLFLAGAGNEGAQLPSERHPPSAVLAANELPNVVVVGAANLKGQRARLSNHGAPFVDVAALGAAVFSAYPGGLYSFQDGTSMATPIVTNLAAKCLVLDPSLKVPELKRLLIETSKKRAGWAGVVEAGGPIDAAFALQVAAARGLLQRGATEAQASARLKLSGKTKQKVLAMAERLR